jgi:hypothetical protein
MAQTDDIGCVQVQTTTGYTVFQTRRRNAWVMSENLVLKQTFPVETDVPIERTTATQRLGRNWPAYIDNFTTDTEAVQKRHLLVEQLRGDASDQCFNFRLNRSPGT